MTRIEGLGPVGISLNIAPDETHLGEAARLESLGYSAIWLAGGQIDSLDRISAAVRATESIPVATASSPSTCTTRTRSRGSMPICRSRRRAGSSSDWAARRSPGRSAR
nr:hypothetical protein [Rhodococcus pseudokoreensis]